MCGASQEQKDLGKAQTDFYNQLTASYKTVFGQQQEILKGLTDVFTPILQAGPTQRGFSGEERTALNTQVRSGTAANYDKAQTALSENLAARGGGSEFLPSGADEQLRSEVASSAAGEMSREENQVTQADYATGRANFFGAEQALSGAAGMLSPSNYAGAANNAGSAAASTEQQIAEAQNAWMGPVFGAVGGVLGGLAGNPRIFGGGKRGGN